MTVESVSALGCLEEEDAATNLRLFTGRVEPGAIVPGPPPRVIGGLDTTKSLAGTGGPLKEPVPAPSFCCSSAEYFCKSSPIVSLRNDSGMRLTRISIRVRRLCA